MKTFYKHVSHHAINFCVVLSIVNKKHIAQIVNDLYSITYRNKENRVEANQDPSCVCEI